MKRRTFIQAIAAIVPFAGASSARSAPRFYSVDNGAHGRVYLDGREVPFVRSCKTGRNGWVKQYANDGTRITSGDKHYLRGRVTFKELYGTKWTITG